MEPLHPRLQQRSPTMGPAASPSPSRSLRKQFADQLMSPRSPARRVPSGQRSGNAGPRLPAPRTRMEQDSSSNISSSSGGNNTNPILGGASDVQISRRAPELLLQQFVDTFQQSFQESLSKSVARLGEEYGMTALPLVSEKMLLSATSDKEDNQEISNDVRALIQQLQSARMREKEMKLIVDDLQDEQKIAKEKLALYSLLTMKLKRELLSEKLAHIDSKKEIEDLRAKAAQAGGKDGTQSEASGAPSSPEQSPQDAEDPWNSPEKISGEPPKSSRVLSFGSFYSSSRGPGVHGEEDEPSSPSSGIQPLRNSLLGQYLPSSLLDSPQTGVEHPKTFDEDEDEDNQTQNDTIRDGNPPSEAAGPTGEAKSELVESKVASTRCEDCDKRSVSRCEPCGHLVCGVCADDLDDAEDADRVCAQCGAAVSTVEPLSQFPDQIGSPKNDRDVSTTRKSSDHQSQQKGSRIAVSPVTLSLLTELFETIPLDELEAILKECSGQASLAIERILQTHVSFNPTLVADSSAPPASTSKTVAHRSNSVSSTSNTQSSNWKTELCMYYLQGKCNKTRRTCSFAHGENDLVRSTSSKHVPSTSYKTRMCPLYLEGNCPKSRRECSMAHGEADLREGLPALNAATSTLPATTPPRLQNYKTELCYYFLKGCCNYTKEECRFAHGESDLRTVESNTLEWSSQRNNASASSFQNEFVPGSHSSPGMSGAPGSNSSAASAMDKMQQLQHQHQYQQQYQQQAQAYQMQQGFVAPGHHQLPQQHQLPPHQFAHGPGQHLHQQVALQHHHQSLPQQPAMPPQHQQGMYHAHANAAQPPPPFRYMKGGEEMNKRGRPQPRRENSWSGSYDGMHTPGMPPSDF